MVSTVALPKDPRQRVVGGAQSSALRSCAADCCDYACAPAHRALAHLQDSHTPKNFILDIQFSTKEGGKLLILLRRENYGKPSLNGIGIQMVKLSSKRPMGEEPADKLTKKICWYQV